MDSVAHEDESSSATKNATEVVDLEEEHVVSALSSGGAVKIKKETVKRYMKDHSAGRTLEGVKVISDDFDLDPNTITAGLYLYVGNRRRLFLEMQGKKWKPSGNQAKGNFDQLSVEVVCDEHKLSGIYKREDYSSDIVKNVFKNDEISGKLHFVKDSVQSEKGKWQMCKNDQVVLATNGSHRCDKKPSGSLTWHVDDDESKRVVGVKVYTEEEYMYLNWSTPEIPKTIHTHRLPADYQNITILQVVEKSRKRNSCKRRKPNDGCLQRATKSNEESNGEEDRMERIENFVRANRDYMRANRDYMRANRDRIERLERDGEAQRANGAHSCNRGGDRTDEDDRKDRDSGSNSDDSCIMEGVLSSLSPDCQDSASDRMSDTDFDQDSWFERALETLKEIDAQWSSCITSNHETEMLSHFTQVMIALGEEEKNASYAARNLVRLFKTREKIQSVIEEAKYEAKSDADEARPTSAYVFDIIKRYKYDDEGYYSALSVAAKKSGPLPKLRKDQREAIAEAKKNDLLVCLPPGRGKTRIGVECIKSFRNESDPSQTAVYIVPTRFLAMQMSVRLYHHHGLKVKHIFSGAKDSRPKHWNRFCQEYDVLICVDGWLSTKLVGGELSLKTFVNQAHTIVFDEAHHGIQHKKSDGHPIRQILRAIITNRKDTTEDVGLRMIGLTATPSHGRSLEAHEKHFAELKNYFGGRAYCKCKWDDDDTACAESACVEPEHFCIEDRLIDILVPRIVAIMKRYEKCIEGDVPDRNNTKKYREFLKKKIEEENGAGVEEQSENRESIDACNLLLKCADFKTVAERESAYLALREMGEEMLRCLFEKSDDHFNRDIANILCRIYLIMHMHMNRVDACKIKYLEEELLIRTKFRVESKCVVFMRTRIGARALARYLKCLSMREDDRYHHLRASCAVGKGGMTTKELKKVLNDFEEGNVNVLVATSVAEEGINFPECDIVVCLDGVDNATKWVQKRGRARKNDSSTFVVCANRAEVALFQRSLREEKYMKTAMARIPTKTDGGVK